MASAPSAADSVGVAQPADMATMTMTKIATSGVTYTSSGRQRSQPTTRLLLEGRRQAGLSQQRMTM